MVNMIIRWLEIMDESDTERNAFDDCNEGLVSYHSQLQGELSKATL